jgi:hypothetical protein
VNARRAGPRAFVARQKRLAGPKVKRGGSCDASRHAPIHQLPVVRAATAAHASRMASNRRPAARFPSCSDATCVAKKVSRVGVDMAKNSRIEWTDHTFNPWWGCSKTSHLACSQPCALVANEHIGIGLSNDRLRQVFACGMGIGDHRFERPDVAGLQVTENVAVEAWV